MGRTTGRASRWQNDSSSRRRRRVASATVSRSKIASPMPKAAKTPNRTPAKPTPAKKAVEPQVSHSRQEVRLRRFRPKPPQSFFAIYERATTQRFFVLDRSSRGSPRDPEEVFDLAGTTGNIYQVRIKQKPECNCPHAEKGNQCKHWLYVMSRVLRAKWEYVYQLALVPSELRAIFDNASQPVNAKPDNAEDTPGGRKPIEGDCGICFTELLGDNGQPTEKLVWCRAACGQNIHSQCFGMWEATKNGGRVTCPYCRSPWESGPTDVAGVAKAAKEKPRNSEGYVNVAQELGLSGERDYSMYSDWFFRSRGEPY